MSEGDAAFACAFALVDELVTQGVSHACLSPGSRSTPLALALWRHPGIRVHVHLDERASSFVALGLAKATGEPVVVGCTSGTAAAEFLPAMVEAWMSRTPLVVLTADRPPELRGVGANQTIDQVGLYGRHAKWFVDAAVPGDRPDPRYWRELGREALREAGWGPPGPVHVNLPFREPLVPSEALVPETGPRSRRITRTGGRPEELETFVAELASVSRGVLLAGSLRRPAPSLVELARRLAWPLLAEPTSGLRVPGALRAGPLLVADDGFAASNVPDLLVQLGAAPTSRPALAFVENARRLVIVDPDRLIADPYRKAGWTIDTDPEALAAGALPRLDERPGSGWLDGWLEADHAARAAVDALLDGWSEPYEGRVARDLAQALPDGSTLVVGSSMPVRDLDAYMRPRGGLRVLANRGASGIDGFVSTALGVAAAGTPTVALCGDLTLLHDAGSLLWSARRGYHCVFVVPNNEGGVIFSFLRHRDLPELEDLFTTPHRLDLGALCATAGAGHTRVERASGLVPALEHARTSGGVHVLEVPIDRGSNVRRHAEVHEAVAAALRG
ncbi:MAG TPA: 2-succinyl-5-enolpyruvyl-6-hydroxy-3-cyclohexene-1-carboxylic-acid synthase [Actinomycetota bacterium]|nr:2-succinyl-5-enolpyruvyl-6-hydroxy-3-cyclohexene-1-carboxylic-acid synthase [Actinomycetota bacterium]